MARLGTIIERIDASGAEFTVPFSLIDPSYAVDLSAGAKGSLFGMSAAGIPGLQGVGSDRKVLVADSAQSLGLAYDSRLRMETTVTAASSHSNSTSESSDLISYTFAAGFLNTTSKVVGYTIFGMASTTSAPNLTLRTKLNDTLGAQTIGSPSGASPGSSVTDRLCFARGLLIRSSSSRLLCCNLALHANIQTNALCGVASPYMSITLANAITISQTAQWSAASVSNVYTPVALVIEEFN